MDALAQAVSRPEPEPDPGCGGHPVEICGCALTLLFDALATYFTLHGSIPRDQESGHSFTHQNLVLLLRAIAIPWAGNQEGRGALPGDAETAGPATSAGARPCQLTCVCSGRGPLSWSHASSSSPPSLSAPSTAKPLATNSSFHPPSDPLEASATATRTSQGPTAAAMKLLGRLSSWLRVQHRRGQAAAGAASVHPLSSMGVLGLQAGEVTDGAGATCYVQLMSEVVRNGLNDDNPAVVAAAVLVASGVAALGSDASEMDAEAGAAANAGSGSGVQGTAHAASRGRPSSDAGGGSGVGGSDTETKALDFADALAAIR